MSEQQPQRPGKREQSEDPDHAASDGSEFLERDDDHTDSEGSDYIQSPRTTRARVRQRELRRGLSAIGQTLKQDLGLGQHIRAPDKKKRIYKKHTRAQKDKKNGQKTARRRAKREKMTPEEIQTEIKEQNAYKMGREREKKEEAKTNSQLAEHLEINRLTRNLQRSQRYAARQEDPTRQGDPTRQEDPTAHRERLDRINQRNAERKESDPVWYKKKLDQGNQAKRERNEKEDSTARRERLDRRNQQYAEKKESDPVWYSTMIERGSQRRRERTKKKRESLEQSPDEDDETLSPEGSDDEEMLSHETYRTNIEQAIGDIVPTSLTIRDWEDILQMAEDFYTSTTQTDRHLAAFQELINHVNLENVIDPSTQSASEILEIIADQAIAATEQREAEKGTRRGGNYTR